MCNVLDGPKRLRRITNFTRDLRPPEVSSALIIGAVVRGHVDAATLCLSFAVIASLERKEV
jgi:hypothetical protein